MLFHAGARHPCCACGAVKERKEHGRRATDPNFFYAGHPAPMCGDFCPLRPASSPGRFGFRHLAPLKRSEPRTGRIAGRAGYSASFLLHARRFRRARVLVRRRLQEPPEARVPMLTPQAPLPARIARLGHRTTPLRWAGTGVVYRNIIRVSRRRYTTSYLSIGEIDRPAHISTCGLVSGPPIHENVLMTIDRQRVVRNKFKARRRLGDHRLHLVRDNPSQPVLGVVVGIALIKEAAAIEFGI